MPIADVRSPRKMTMTNAPDQTVNPSRGSDRGRTVFISYSHADKKWRDRLYVFLKPLESDGTVVRWDDTEIRPGQNWRNEIKRAIDKAKIAVLLVTADYLASDFIRDNELPPLLAAAEEDGAVIMPVVVSPCLFNETTNLSKFQAVNSPSKPLSNMSKSAQAELWVKLTKDIVRVLRDSAPPSASPNA
jgi:hypothetical protein